MTTTTNHPPKHLVREYLERRSKDPKPPPTPEEIRRQLGWGMLMPSDDRIGASFELAAEPHQALDVFNHPDAHAAFHGRPDPEASLRVLDLPGV